VTSPEEQELRHHLDTALMTITPRPAPIDAVMRQGRHVMYRRRISVTAGLAVAAAVLVAAPIWLHQAKITTTLQARPPVVTVVLPGHNSPSGLIASGKVGSRTWSARVMSDKNGRPCVLAGSYDCGLFDQPSSLVDTEGGASDNGTPVLYGPVKPAVTRVTVRLSDGQRLVLHPTKINDSRWIAFPVPQHVGVIRATAYAGRHELRYAIPFNGAADLPPSPPTFGVWLKPGAVPHPQATFQVGSGVVDGESWVEKEYSGPWGSCFALVGAGRQVCLAGFGSYLFPHEVVHPIVESPGDSSGPSLFLSAVAPSVARVTVTVSGGEVLQPAITVGDSGLKYITYNIGKGHHPLRWTAYDATGHQLGSGNAGITS
jgi:hypothetical protein